MLHLLLGLNPSSLGSSPFAPTITRSLTVKAVSVGLAVFRHALLFTLPSVSAYIGSDIVAGACVIDLKKAKENIFFIDIGTNGEVILAVNGKLLSCSCAAGPALEGMNIHHGMRAAAGAIEEICITWSPLDRELKIDLKVIENITPVGLCGSGILALIRELLKIGLIRPDGRLMKSEDLPTNDPRRKLCTLFNDKPAIEISSGSNQIFITQKDVRQVQLAKGAILSAFEALLIKAGLTVEQIDRVLVAGQFGSYLSPESLTGCGLIPKILEGKIEFWGNTSKTGAFMALMSQEVRHKMDSLAREIDYFELATVMGYERLFTKAMKFPSA